MKGERFEELLLRVAEMETANGKRSIWRVDGNGFDVKEKERKKKNFQKLQPFVRRLCNVDPSESVEARARKGCSSLGRT